MGFTESSLVFVLEVKRPGFNPFPRLAIWVNFSLRFFILEEGASLLQPCESQGLDPGQQSCGNQLSNLTGPGWVKECVF